ncbi:hypothetical protein EDC01DRAFT_789427 [Geopyxis carbonaria]|nr:hypothetical protein EDC01DRAFT_789427 [Geopyxis carbonaria]
MNRAVLRLRPSRLLARPTPPHTPRLSLQQCRAASTLQERLRRKLWGTNDPVDPELAAAETATEEAVDRTNYVAAIDARGLPIAGVEVPLGVWQVDSYAPSYVVRDTASLHRAVRRALVETFALSTHGRDLSEAFKIDTPTGVEAGLVTEEVSIDVSPEGEVRLDFAGQANTILSSLEPPPDDVPKAEDELAAPVEAEAEAVPETPVIEAEPAVEGEPVEAEANPTPAPAWLQDSLRLSGAGASWQSTPLTSLAFRFALCKRILQLTGQRPPDIDASQAKTAGDLLTPLLARPKAQKLAEELTLREQVAKLPNVKLFDSRIRPLDRDRMLGREVKVEDVVEYTYEGVDDTAAMRARAWKGHVTYENVPKREVKMRISGWKGFNRVKAKAT